MPPLFSPFKLPAMFLSKSAAFDLYASAIAHLSREEQLALFHFFRWLFAQVGVRREYVWENWGERQSGVYTVLGVLEQDGDLYVVFRTKTGKKEWRQLLFGCYFRGHWYLKNKEAGSLVARVLAG